MSKIIERARSIKKKQDDLRAEIVAAICSADAPNKTLRHSIDMYTSEIPLIKIEELERHLDVDMLIWTKNKEDAPAKAKREAEDRIAKLDAIKADFLSQNKAS